MLTSVSLLFNFFFPNDECFEIKNLKQRKIAEFTKLNSHHYQCW